MTLPELFRLRIQKDNKEEEVAIVYQNLIVNKFLIARK